MIGTTLANAVTLLKSELMSSLTVGTGNDALYQKLIETKQEWFASMYDWLRLRDEWTVAFTAGLGGRYQAVPTTDDNGNSYSINFDRPVKFFVKYSTKWQPITQGINAPELNIWNSDLGQAQDPVMKWQFKPGDYSYFEFWPLGTVTQYIRIEGQRKLATLRTAGSLDTTKTLDLDDRLVTLAVAVDQLTAKEDAAAKSKSDMLAALWQTLRAAETPELPSFPLRRPVSSHTTKVVPVRVVTV